MSTPQPPAAESGPGQTWGEPSPMTSTPVPATPVTSAPKHDASYRTYEATPDGLSPQHPHSEGALFHTHQPESSRETKDVIPPADQLGPTGRKTREVPEPKPLPSHGPAKIIAMCNQKGGVGKTTSTINLGASLAAYGRRVLLVDLDPQGALSAGLGVAHHELDLTVYNLLVESKVSADDVLMRTRVENLDLLPSNIDLSAAEIQLVTEVGREQTLGRVLHPVLDRYDYVLIDCQPSLGLLTVNALTCADEVLIPMECEYFSLRGLALLNDTVEKVRDRLNPRLKLAGIVVTRVDARTLHSREVMTRVVEVFGDVVYDTVITRTVRFPETSVAGEPITTWAPKSSGAQAYRALAREVIYRSGP